MPYYVLLLLCTPVQLNGLAIRSLKDPLDPFAATAHEGPVLKEPFFRFADTANLNNSGREVAHRESSAGSMADRENKSISLSEGVVCPTLLHKKILNQNLLPFLSITPGLAQQKQAFVDKVRQLCGGSSGLESSEYTGTWSQQSATKNDIRVMRGMFDWVRKYRTSTEEIKYANGKQGPMIFKIANLDPALRVRRVMDFGCGSGGDLMGAMKEFDISAEEDALCVDIGTIKVPGVTPISLDVTSDATYKESLDTALAGNRGSVHVVFSFVTFHHVNQGPKMRQNAFRFISQVLVPRGIFIMSDWDNSAVPDRTIWFDLQHFLPSLVQSSMCPSHPDQLSLGTAYFGWKEWDSQIREASSEALVLQTDGPMPHPRKYAERPGNVNRDFEGVWKRRAV
mmetsp:Transcript_92137/g.176562  ORF Transcript_92137/g.176562 Transcript_92137/m.176562 type:complete len:396 (+) Transcript_92137:95-1282(+)